MSQTKKILMTSMVATMTLTLTTAFSIRCLPKMPTNSQLFLEGNCSTLPATKDFFKQIEKIAPKALLS